MVSIETRDFRPSLFSFSVFRRSCFVSSVKRIEFVVLRFFWGRLGYGIGQAKFISYLYYTVSSWKLQQYFAACSLLVVSRRCAGSPRPSHRRCCVADDCARRWWVAKTMCHADLPRAGAAGAVAAAAAAIIADKCQHRSWCRPLCGVVLCFVG